MSNQPKALFLADVMHNDPCSKAHHDAAAFELRRLHAQRAALRQIVDEQAEDEGLWFRTETAAEAYLQQALRRLHAAVEGEHE